MKAAVIQMNSVSDVAANIAKAGDLVARAASIWKAPTGSACRRRWNWAGGSSRDKAANADDIPGGRAYEAAQRWAADNRIWVHAGSLLEAAKDADGKRLGKVHNTTVVFDRSGTEVARYRKIHLFDIVAPDGTEYRESPKP